MSHERRVNILVDLSEKHAHLFNITMKLFGAWPNQRLSLPAWTPGSYMIREFAQHIISFKAYAEEEQAYKKIDKNTFEILSSSPELTLKYQVYGFDSSIRAAFIDDTQAFFNGTALFFRAHGFENNSYELEISSEEEWQVATGMRAKKALNNFAYEAQSYDELVDYPFQISPMRKLSFMANKITHEIVLVGDVRKFDEKRLIKDLKKLCEKITSMFVPPFDKYLFIARFQEGAHGGLEHRNSSMLLATPSSLPKIGMLEPDANYRNFLSLCAHEYFHAWNIKELKPKNFHNLDYDNECYTTMLWLFEGITSYYDDLLVKKANLISLESYLELLAKNYGRLLKNPGRLNQSVADASFDAWIKFYRPNENSSNTQVSYYLKGSFIGLYLDLLIRSKSNKSLDDVMKEAFKYKYISEEEFFNLLNQAGVNIDDFKSNYIYGTKDLPLRELLVKFGIELSITHDDLWFDEKNKLQAFLGFRLRFEGGLIAINFVEKDSPANLAGLSFNDELIAINNIRLDAHNFIELLSSISPGESAQILIARKKVLFEKQIIAKELPQTSARFLVKKDITAKEQENLNRWLG
jgi:predicted metalloprotease with PDZ domain